MEPQLERYLFLLLTVSTKLVHLLASSQRWWEEQQTATQLNENGVPVSNSWNSVRRERKEPPKGQRNEETLQGIWGLQEPRFYRVSLSLHNSIVALADGRLWAPHRHRHTRGHTYRHTQTHADTQGCTGTHWHTGAHQRALKMLQNWLKKIRFPSHLPAFFDWLDLVGKNGGFQVRFLIDRLINHF